MSSAENAQALLDLLSSKGTEAYFGEEVSVLAHCLQCAHFAERSEASPATITAALLHDIGHILHNLPENIAQLGLDGRHEDIGANYLSTWFGADVTETVRMHVAAKRYLCATQPSYIAQLSPSSVESLQLQGGPMGDDEANAFEASPHAQHAVAVRRWDDEAKIRDMEVPGVQHYLPILQAAMRSPGAR